ncbi:hypothetical protein [Paenibacillus sp. Marseille-Q4541]|uniref:hypothetical protein n=1 Tax=Paenibacillus sp. Marseille-Q4541 TaxID=2831522 RepID=UPI001BA61A7F|nr:hypothetical protein [Paenibacillus sp. Marseille-Q4541]
METTVCPWCQTEIVWDEELGPEEECPYCHNPLSAVQDQEESEITADLPHRESEAAEQTKVNLEGYRTVNLTLTEEEELLKEETISTEEDEEDYSNLWEDETDTILPTARVLDQYEDSGIDMAKYSSAVQSILDVQEEAPECPNCREFMLHTGVQTVTRDSFTKIQSLMPPLEAPFGLNIYVCPSCFQTTQSLASEDRLRMVKRLSQSK